MEREKYPDLVLTRQSQSEFSTPSKKSLIDSNSSPEEMKQGTPEFVEQNNMQITRYIHSREVLPKIQYVDYEDQEILNYKNNVSFDKSELERVEPTMKGIMKQY